MRRTVTWLLTLALVAGATASHGAGSWRRHRETRLGFSMLVPRGAAISQRSWREGWRGVHVRHRRATLYGLSVPGKKLTAHAMRAMAERVSGVAREHWTVIKTVKARGGWVWYCPARAAHGGKVVRAVYGLGRRGAFLMVLVTGKVEARRSRSAHARWARTVRLR